jgi:hypothetical protein
MLEQYSIPLMLVGIAVIIGLVWLIRWQLSTQQRAQAERQRLRAENEAKLQQQRDYLVESVKVISLAIRDGQCELTEGCIRLKRLLDHLAPWLHQDQQFSVINLMYQATEHMPILDEWKKLKLKQRFEYTQQREALEAQHGEAIQAAAKALVEYNFNH